MHKIFSRLALALMIALAPAMAQAKDDEPAPARVYAQIDYNPADDPDNVLYLDLSTGQRVTIRLMPDWAPNHVERIKTLTRQGFYDGVIFHRVIDGFMAQTGDPTGTGTGGSELPDVAQEFNPMPHLRGTVSMARAQDPDSANSQFFIVFYPRFSLDRNYTNFGRVIANMDAVDQIARGEPPANPTRIVHAFLGSSPAPALPSVTPPTADPVSEAIVADDQASAPAQ
ncbi:MAG: peptidylprolyl isomerase [Novosphingobium sp.]